MWLILAFALAAVATMSAQPSTPVTGADEGYQKVLNYIVDPRIVVYSRTFSESDTEWQQGVYSIPVAIHPLFDYQGPRDCSIANGSEGELIYVPNFNAT
jgi:hypothetical protein